MNNNTIDLTKIARFSKYKHAHAHMRACTHSIENDVNNKSVSFKSMSRFRFTLLKQNHKLSSVLGFCSKMFENWSGKNEDEKKETIKKREREFTTHVGYDKNSIRIVRICTEVNVKKSPWLNEKKKTRKKL